MEGVKEIHKESTKKRYAISLGMERQWEEKLTKSSSPGGSSGDLHPSSFLPPLTKLVSSRRRQGERILLILDKLA